MRKNLHAYTGTNYKNYPEYISVNEEENGQVSITVRSKDSNVASVIYLSAEQAEQLATDIIANINE